MNKMDEIKGRLENVSTKRGVDLFHARNAFDTHSEADIDYLLSIIEQAEKVLTETKDDLAKVVNKMCGGVVKQYIFEDTRKVYYSVSEALKAIRG